MTKLPFQNQVHPFLLANTNLRGRMVRMGAVLDDILGSHDYPLPVAKLLAEAIVLAVTLSNLLKYEGVFTLQVKGSGAVSLLIADCTSGRTVRGYARFDSEQNFEPLDVPIQELLGTGYLAFTVDQGKDTDRYQGIVELHGDNLVETFRHYFSQSEQLQTGISLFLKAPNADHGWQAAAILVQKLPDVMNNESMLGGAGAEAMHSDVLEDDWRRTMLLLGTLTEDEAMDSNLLSPVLLYRLFHEEGLQVFEARDLSKDCRCSVQKLTNVLAALPSVEVQELLIEGDGKLEMTCEFCNKTFVFTADDIAQIDLLD